MPPNKVMILTAEGKHPPLCDMAACFMCGRPWLMILTTKDGPVCDPCLEVCVDIVQRIARAEEPRQLRLTA